MTKKPRKSNGKIKDNSALRNLRPSQLRSASACPRGNDADSPVLITGGAGFIGSNVADSYLSAGQKVLLFDNFSRPGVERNVGWLRAKHGDLVQIEEADVQDFSKLREAVRGVSKVFHFAAQVAVTTSLGSPFHDFGVNARGTLNLLEALRELRQPPPLIYTSTNKVYGRLNDVPLRERPSRYEPERDLAYAHGFDEARPLDFHSPYGCSKGAAEQYVLDYARTFGLPAVVFRMSCVYGPRQFGTEDQGWVAHFLIRALEGSVITVFGDGKQVRDILFVDDLVQAFVLAQEHMATVSGHAFNIGGGPAHTISLLELMDLIAKVQGVRPRVRFDDWRPADQQYYVSDIRKFSAATGWSPEVDVREGLYRLGEWLRQTTDGRPPLDPSVANAVCAPDQHADGAAATALAENGADDIEGEIRRDLVWKLTNGAAAPGAGKIIKFP